MPLPFNKTLDLKLIALVKENPIIYNSKHDKYLDYDTREVVWQKIGDLLNRPAPLCKTRWVNIRDMLRRKVRDRLRRPDHTTRYSYKYEDQLAFMLPHFKESNYNHSSDYDYFDAAQRLDLTDFQELSTREAKPSASLSQEVEYQELNPADPVDVFLITIGTTLRKFNPYYLNLAKSKIFQVVQDYELEQIVNKHDQPASSGSSLRQDKG